MPRDSNLADAGTAASRLTAITRLIKVGGGLLLACGIGIVIDRILLLHAFPLVATVAFRGLAFVSLLMLLLALIAIWVKHVVTKRLRASLAADQGIIPQELQALMRRALFGEVLASAETAEQRAARTRRLTSFALEAAKLVAAGYGLRQALVILGIGLGGAVAAATLLTAYLQIDRLDAQNALLRSQNMLTIENQRFESGRMSADSSYEQIASILLDPRSNEQSQILALSLVPESMRIAVPRIESNGSTDVHTVVEFPNAGRLRRVLLAFLRLDRIGDALRAAGLSEENSDWEAFRSAVNPKASVSDAVVTLLHRLGPRDPKAPSVSLWNESQKNATAMPEPRDTPELPVTVVDKVKIVSLRDPLVYDLRHLEPDVLRGAQLPLLFATNLFGERRKVLFPPHLELVETRLEGAVLEETDLSRTSLARAKLRGARLNDVSLSCSYLESADLRQVSWTGGHSEGMNARSVDLSGATVEGVALSGSFFERSKWNGADVTAQLQGANLSDASLWNATFDGSYLLGASFERVGAIGASFQDAHAEGARFSGDFTRANFSQAGLGGSRWSDATIGGTNFTRARFAASVVRVKRRSLEECNWGDVGYYFGGPIYGMVHDVGSIDREMPPALLESRLEAKSSAELYTVVDSPTPTVQALLRASYVRLAPRDRPALVSRELLDRVLPAGTRLNGDILRYTGRPVEITGANFNGVIVDNPLLGLLGSDAAKATVPLTDEALCRFARQYPLERVVLDIECFDDDPVQ